MVDVFSRKDAGFLVKFFLLFFAPYLAMNFFGVPWLTPAIAGVEAFLFGLVGFRAVADGALLYVNGFSFEIVPDCTGLMMVFLLLALLWATDIKEARRRKAFLLFAPFLLLFNLLRLFATLWTGVTYGLQAMDSVHVLLWFVDSGLVLALWYLVFSGKWIKTRSVNSLL